MGPAGPPVLAAGRAGYLAVASGPTSRSKQRACGDRRMNRLRGTSALTAALVFMLAAVLASCGSTVAAPRRADPRLTLTFHVIVKTPQKLDSIVWTGRQFLYVQN